MAEIKNKLMGAIVGDIVGSIYEGRRNHAENKNFQLFTSYNHFTDDTVLTIAIADWFINKGDVRDYLRKWSNKYPNAGYGKTYRAWFTSPKTDEKIDSWGNGSAMRVSSVGWVANSLEEALDLAKQTAEWTHNHEEGIKGAQATAACIFLARLGSSKEEIKNYIEETFHYDLSRKLDDIKPNYHFSSWCQTSVPESIICFLESHSYEETIRNAVWLDGDTDTMAAIGGSIAAAFYNDGVPQWMVDIAKARLPKEMVDIIEQFDTI